MTYSVITSKGQITIPKNVRDRLNLKTGDKLDFRIEEGGDLRLVPVGGSVVDLFGMLSKERTKPITVERMNAELKRSVGYGNK